jgi:hypothetical protein
MIFPQTITYIYSFGVRNDQRQDEKSSTGGNGGWVDGGRATHCNCNIVTDLSEWGTLTPLGAPREWFFFSFFGSILSCRGLHTHDISGLGTRLCYHMSKNMPQPILRRLWQARRRAGNNILPVSLSHIPPHTPRPTLWNRSNASDVPGSYEPPPHVQNYSSH